MTRPIFSRLALRATLTLLLGAAALCAQAQSFPSRSIRLVVPAVPGGSSDSIARALARVMQEEQGVNVIVDNRGGGSGTIGSGVVAHAPNDGYTVLLSDGTIALFPLLSKQPPTYVLEKNLIPLLQAVSTNFAFAAAPNLNVPTLKEFVDLARSRPGKLTYSTPGNGSLGQLVMEALKARTGIDVLHVPYKGSAPAMMAVIAQEVDVTVTSPASLKGFIEKGQLRAIATTGRARSPVLPAVPTAIEAGVPDFVFSAWWGFFLPADVPKPVSDKLAAMFQQALRSPEFVRHAAGLSLDVTPVAGREFSQAIVDENAKWKQLIDQSNIRMD